MRVGMMNDPRLDPLAEARWAAANGFEFLDLTIEAPAATLDHIDAAELRYVLEVTGLGVVGHTAWYLPFALPDPGVRRAAVDAVAAAFELFAGLGADRVNVHLGRSVPLIGRDAGLALAGQSFAELAERAAAYNLQIIVEHPPDAAFGVAEIERVLNADDRLGFHLDVGHANVGANRIAAMIERFGHRLAHVHMSDNRGRSDDHLPLGAGFIDWPEVVDLLKQQHYDDTITLEVFSNDREFLLLSARKLRHWWAAWCSDER